MPRKPCNKIRDVKAVILAGRRDFGRSPLASCVPTVLWPVVDKSALEHLLRHLSRQGIKQATVCSSGDASLMQKAVAGINSMQVTFLDEPLPVGTAGCVRDASNGDKDELFLVFPATILTPPNVDALIQTHRAGKSDLTVMLEPELENNGSRNHSSGIYICEASVLEYIPEEGYCDIKEGLVPAMLRAGRTIHAARLPRPVGNFRDRTGYLNAIAEYLQSNNKVNMGLHPNESSGSKIWLADSAKVDSSARIYGPVVVMDGADISKQSVVFGPTVIGRNVSIGNGSLIVNSILWDDASVGQNCEIRRCLLDNNANVPDSRVLEEKEVPYKKKTPLQTALNRDTKLTKSGVERFGSSFQNRSDKFNKLLNWLTSKTSGKNALIWLSTAIVSVAFLWSYWPGITDLWRVWRQSDEYSSGLLVPFVALYILWSKRHKLIHCRLKPSAWGLFAFILAQAIRLFGAFFMYGSAERASIVFSVAALVLLLFGWQIFGKVFTTLLFLGLMLPPPRSIHRAVMLPLQSWATSSAVFFLEMLGYQVIQEGNIIHLNDTTVAVAEACNGLRMIMAFFVINGLVVLLANKTWWEKLIVLASSIPVGLFCNSVRLTITAIAFTMLHGKHWEKIFHDFGGYAMIPLALGIVVLELWFLTKITTPPIEKQTVLAGK